LTQELRDIISAVPKEHFDPLPRRGGISVPLGGSDTVPADFKQEIKGLKGKLREIGGVQLSGSVEAEAIWMRSGEHTRVTNSSSGSTKSGVVGGVFASFFPFLHVIIFRLFFPISSCHHLSPLFSHFFMLSYFASFSLFLHVIIFRLFFPISSCYHISPLFPYFFMSSSFASFVSQHSALIPASLFSYFSLFYFASFVS
jgi:hypothetical protein